MQGRGSSADEPADGPSVAPAWWSGAEGPRARRGRLPRRGLVPARVCVEEEGVSASCLRRGDDCVPALL